MCAAYLKPCIAWIKFDAILMETAPIMAHLRKTMSLSRASALFIFCLVGINACHMWPITFHMHSLVGSLMPLDVFSRMVFASVRQKVSHVRGFWL